MRNLLTLAAAASVLAIGVSTDPAAASSPGAKATSPEGTVQKVQRGGEPMGPSRLK
jgi:hypothetical protein